MADCDNAAQRLRTAIAAGDLSAAYGVVRGMRASQAEQVSLQAGLSVTHGRGERERRALVQHTIARAVRAAKGCARSRHA